MPSLLDGESRDADPESLKVAGRTIVIAVLSNTLVKAGMAVFWAPPLRRTVLLVTLFLLMRLLPVP
jgi:uncharacterized membrane protein (DUF4010 family)